jgi:hypothetical protein
MAEFILNDFELDTSMKNLIIHENKPVTLGGCPAFRLVFSYRKAGTLHYKCVLYGFQKNDMFYSVRYTAPLRHYFETYLRAFETIAASLTVTDDTRPGDRAGKRNAAKIVLHRTIKEKIRLDLDKNGPGDQARAS